MIDGPTQAINHEQTESNRALATAFIQDVFIDAKFTNLDNYLANDQLIQHHPDLHDGRQSLEQWLQADIKHHKIHRVLAEGNFALVACEGVQSGKPTAFYHYLRIEAHHIIEHWCTIETIAPKSEWKHQNGKF